MIFSMNEKYEMSFLWICNFDDDSKSMQVCSVGQVKKNAYAEIVKTENFHFNIISLVQNQIW